MKRIVLTAALAAIAVLGLSGRAFADSRCPAARNQPSGALDTVKGKVVYSRALGKAEIAGRHRRVGQDMQIVGVTETRPSLRYSITHRVNRRGSEGYCAYAREVTASVGFPTFTVYIAKEYGPNSCQYRAVLAHEREHVKAYETVLRNFSSKLKRRFRQTLDRMDPIYLKDNDGDAALNAIGAAIDKEMQPLLTKMMYAAEDANAEIDLPKSYRRMMKRCPKW